MRQGFKALLWAMAALLATACARESVPPAAPAPTWALVVPEGFPPPPIPDDNLLTAARVALGRRLFYDPVLSRDSTVACASCHKQEYAFADNRPTSPGVEGRPGLRNSPSLANAAYQQRLLREGGVPTLEMQVLVPIQEHNEFDFNILLIADRLRAIPEYVEMARAAYQREPDAFVITRSLAAFQRTLLSGYAPFDRYVYGGQAEAVSAAVLRGHALFGSERLGCASCHNGFLFTTQAFANNGLYLNYADPGRQRLTGRPEDEGVFKIPSLRNVAVTAPYMHDGSVATLETVIDHYAGGGHAHPNRSPLLRPFQLTEAERQDLLRFLESLTDEELLRNPAFSKEE
jgi:cytochrome c peroxidase